VANANMMSYKTGEDFLRHNQPRLNTVLNRLKNEPSTLNMNYYGKNVDPVEVTELPVRQGSGSVQRHQHGCTAIRHVSRQGPEPLRGCSTPSTGVRGTSRRRLRQRPGHQTRTSIRQLATRHEQHR
jgi:hypothetical protein